MTHPENQTSGLSSTGERWETDLKTGLGTAPPSKFDEWKSRNADVLETLNSPTVATLQPKIRLLSSLKWVAAAVLIVSVALLIQKDGSVSTKVYAEAIPGVDNPQSMTWTTTFYGRVTSLDGKRTWIRRERRLMSYRHPGHYRETFLDETGQPRSVDITDVQAGRTLMLDLKEKKAVLKPPRGFPDSRGPFTWIGESLRDPSGARVKSVSLQGSKEIDKTQASVVRVMTNTMDNKVLRQDLFFDEKSKQLVGIWTPNETSYDFDMENAKDRDQSVEDKWSMEIGLASLSHEIVVDAKLDALDFSLDPPKGYTLELQARPTVTESEMVAFLGAATRFNDGQFPDSTDLPFDTDKFNVASFKGENERTPVEKELIEIRDRIMFREIYQSPIKRFVEDQTVPNSFHYVGAGTKLGQADRIVCWYTPRGLNKLRGLFGDLTLRDVAQSELPFDSSK